MFLKTIIDAIKWQSTDLSWIWLKITRQRILATQTTEFLRNTGTSISFTLAGQLRDEPQQSTFHDMICGFFVTSLRFFNYRFRKASRSLSVSHLGVKNLLRVLGCKGGDLGDVFEIELLDVTDRSWLCVRP